jgi:hypothetical protein
MLAVPTRLRNFNVVERRVRGDHTVGWCGNPGSRAKAPVSHALFAGKYWRYDSIDEPLGVALDPRSLLLKTKQHTHARTHSPAHTYTQYLVV